MAKQSPTSITGTSLEKFLAKDHEGIDRPQLGCKKIPGLHVIKLKSGAASWRLNYSDVDGNRVRHTIGNARVMTPPQAAEQAILIRGDLIQDKSPGKGRKAKQAEKTEAKRSADANRFLNVGIYFEEIYSPYQIKYRRTGKFILNGIKSNFGHLFDRNMDTLTGADIAAWYNKQHGKLSRVTLTREFSAFKAMLNHAKEPQVDNKPVLAINPLTSFKFSKLNEKTVEDRKKEQTNKEELKKKRNVIPAEVQEQIRIGLELFAEQTRAQRRNSREHGKAYLPDLDSVDYPHWFIPFTQIAWLTGMRPGDIRVMRWENIAYNPFNGNTQHTFTPEKTKDKGEHPAQVQIPVTGQLLDVLNKWRKQSGNPESGNVFPSSNARGSGTLDKKAYRTHWLKVKKLGGAPEDLDFYCFRHNYISDLVLQGKPPEAIGKIVGHCDGSMISRYYFHLSNQDSAAIVASFSQSIYGNTQDKKEVRA
jgi:integrase